MAPPSYVILTPLRFNYRGSVPWAFLVNGWPIQCHSIVGGAEGAAHNAITTVLKMEIIILI